MTTAVASTRGEPDSPLPNYHPYRYRGQSVGNALLRHTYNKNMRSNPNAQHQVSAHGGTSRYAQWKLLAMGQDIVKLQNMQTGKYLRITQGGQKMDIGGTGGKLTLFHIKYPSTTARDALAFESVQFAGSYLAVNSQLIPYALRVNNVAAHVANINQDILFTLLARMPSNLAHQPEEKKAPAEVARLHSGVVVIQHAMRQSLRVHPANNVALNGRGGTGQLARWTLEVHGDNRIKLRNTKSGKYLRIINKGLLCDVGGTGGLFTLFNYDPVRQTLQSHKFPGAFLGVDAHCDVAAVMRDSADNAADYRYAFTFNYIDADPTVILRHAFGQTLRVHPENMAVINGHGGRGQYAQWTAEYMHNRSIVKLKSTKSGRYLRIVSRQKGVAPTVDVAGGGGQFTTFKYNARRKTLESNKFPGYFLGVCRKDNTVVAVQGASEEVSIAVDVVPLADVANRRKPAQHRPHMLDLRAKYAFDGTTKVVVVRAERFGRTMRVNPHDVTQGNCLGGCGPFAQWKMVAHDANGMVYKLKNTNSSKFIRISGKGEIDVRGNGGRYTQFVVRPVSDGNVVMFESVVFAGKYLACDSKGTMYVHRATDEQMNRECLFSVWVHPCGGLTGAEKDELIQSQKLLIEQQKQFIDQLQSTVAVQQRIIDGQMGYRNEVNESGTQTRNEMGEEDEEDGFEHVASPGSCL